MLAVLLSTHSAPNSTLLAHHSPGPRIVIQLGPLHSHVLLLIPRLFLAIFRVPQHFTSPWELLVLSFVAIILACPNGLVHMPHKVMFAVCYPIPKCTPSQIPHWIINEDRKARITQQFPQCWVLFSVWCLDNKFIGYRLQKLWDVPLGANKVWLAGTLRLKHRLKPSKHGEFAQTENQHQIAYPV